MAHLVENIFYVGDTPWHGLGQKIDEAPTVEAAIIAAGLDWTVDLKPVFLEDGTKIDSAQATVRSSDQSILGVVGTRYKPLQNKDAFAFFNPFVESGLCTLETGGSLSAGKKVWILARIGGSDLPIVGDDVVRKFLLLSNSHDGTISVRVGFTPVRVVCANTLAMAHNNDASQLIRIRHGKNTLTDLENVREVINLANQTFEATAEQYRKLATKTVNSADLRKYIKVVLGITEEDKDLSTRSANQILEVTCLFENGRGNNLIGVRGTAWAAYNAATEYLSHSAGRNADSRYNSLWFGENANRNQTALNEALKLAA
jgi:phage/plasmid-like protein (TIGR03299 family)